MFKWIYRVGVGWWGGAASPQQGGFCKAPVFFHTHANADAVSLLSSSDWRTPAALIQTGALPWKSTGRVATPPWPRKTPWKGVLSRRGRSLRRSRKRAKMTSASPSRGATARPTRTTTPTPVHKRHSATPPVPPTSHLVRFPLLHPHRAFPQPSVGEIPFAGDLYIL